MSPTIRATLLLFLGRMIDSRSFSELGIEGARTRLGAIASRRKHPTVVGRVTDRAILDGRVPLRIYAPAGGGPFPILMYFHGGAFVMGDLDTEDDTCRVICRDVPCIVVSVGYRLAPEHEFPAASDDCLSATRWAFENAAELNGDPLRVVVAGQSAGGHLAAVTALRLRDDGGPRLCGQLLINAITDYHTPATPSGLEYARGYGLTRDDLVWGWNLYLRDASEAANPYVAPMRAPDLTGLPPALVITAECDPLCDEGERYAARLQEAGVPARVSRYAA